jgi:hypothetical protein
LGLAFDSSGNLYAANLNNNTIEKFTPGGVDSVFANTGMNQPTFLASSPAPVPEPSSMALLGLGVLGGGILAVRRRKR